MLQETDLEMSAGLLVLTGLVITAGWAEEIKSVFLKPYHDMLSKWNSSSGTYGGKSGEIMEKKGNLHCP